MKLGLLLFILPSLIYACELTPELTGRVTISVKHGTLDAEFQLNNIPSINDYLIHLNSGLNIAYFRNEKKGVNYLYEKQYTPRYSEESFGYVLKDPKSQQKTLPSTLHLKYTGKFPVIKDMNKASDEGDWKGNIAFNGKHIRTDGFQSAWYPVLYDVEHDQRYDKVTYDIDILCLDCKSIYVNGSPPVSANKGNFKRTTATSVSLFAGDYNIVSYHHNHYLNTDLSVQQLAELEQLTGSFIRYFEEKLSIPYGENLTFIKTAPTSKYDSWYFVVYPSIVAMTHGSGFSQTEASWFKDYMAHELAHYYFGTFKAFNSPIGDMFTESLAEFLSIKATKTFRGKKAYINRISGSLQDIAGEALLPFERIQRAADYGNREMYIYTYAPIIWLLVEKHIGERAMFTWLNRLLTTPAQRTDYQYMMATLADVIKDDSVITQLTEKYFNNPDAINNASELLKP